MARCLPVPDQHALATDLSAVYRLMVGERAVAPAPSIPPGTPVEVVDGPFAGLTGNTFFYNLTLASAMFVGRFFMIVPAMAIAGSLAGKKSIPPSAGTFPTTGGLFVGLVVGVILIIGGLTFFPALALGPIVEHLAMTAGTLY